MYAQQQGLKVVSSIMNCKTLVQGVFKAFQVALGVAILFVVVGHSNTWEANVSWLKCC